MYVSALKVRKYPVRRVMNSRDQLAKPTFRSRYAHTEQSEGLMDTVASMNSQEEEN